MAEPWRIVLSCEHASNRVPERYRGLFAGCEAVLATHRGFDLGIARLAERLAERLGAPLHRGEVTRLLVDLNRSEKSRSLFSEFSRVLTTGERRQLLERYYRPYRQGLADDVAGWIGRGGRVLHIALHSFTPELRGEVRRADLGLLYDPGRPLEKLYCLGLRQRLLEELSGLRIRLNYPYRGVEDSVGRELRRRFEPGRYLGIEFEVNQRLATGDPERWRALQSRLVAVLVEAPFPP